jgi:hypothetical protein
MPIEACQGLRQVLQRSMLPTRTVAKGHQEPQSHSHTLQLQHAKTKVTPDKACQGHSQHHAKLVTVAYWLNILVHSRHFQVQ